MINENIRDLINSKDKNNVYLGLKLLNETKNLKQYSFEELIEFEKECKKLFNNIPYYDLGYSIFIGYFVAQRILMKINNRKQKLKSIARQQYL